MKNTNNKLLGALIILFLWTVLAALLNTPMMPTPFQVLKHLFTSQGMMLLQHLMMSLYRIFISLIIATLLGCIIGWAMATSKQLNSLLSPIVYFLMPIPKVALLPVFMLLFGLGELPKITLITSVIIFQFIVSTQSAITSIEPSLKLSMKSLNMSKWAEIKHLIIPSITPSILSSIRVSFGISFSVLFFAETFSTKFGIGYYIMNSWAMANSLNMYGGIVALSLVGILIYELLDLLENYLLRWK